MSIWGRWGELEETSGAAVLRAGVHGQAWMAVYQASKEHVARARTGVRGVENKCC